jgi:protocatechuate 3,4-dioxygenase beta subunit
MLSSTRQAIACIFCIFSAAILAQSQTGPVKELTSTVSGKVTVKDKPVQGVVIGLRVRDNSGRSRSNTYKGTTDVNGEYRITNVPAGNYVVAPLAPIFVPLEDTADGRTLILNKGENIEHFDFVLMRGGAITGKVVDADGRPVIEQEVQILAGVTNNRMYQGREPGTQGQTDDRGIYRVYGLRPGRYKVAVGQADDGTNGRWFKSAFYKRVFHPSTSDPAQATVIELSEGGEATNVDITLGRAINTFSASGRIIDEAGQPMANVNYGVVQFIDAHSTSSMSTGAVTNSRGEFKLENLVPGKYAVFVRAEGTSDLNAEQVRFEIADEDVTGLVVRTKKGATVSGVVVLEGTDDKAVIEQLRGLMLVASVSVPNSDRPPSGWARVGADGSFTISGLSTGTAMFYISSSSRFRIVRMERNGVVQARGIEVREGEPITGVRLVVNYGNASLRGVVEATGGTLPSGARFFVYLRNVNEDPGSSSSHVSAEVDARGQFVIDGLMPGTYEINAGIMVRDAGMQVAGYKKQLIEVTAGSSNAGSSNNVTISVDLTPVTPRP